QKRCVVGAVGDTARSNPAYALMLAHDALNHLFRPAPRPIDGHHSREACALQATCRVLAKSAVFPNTRANGRLRQFEYECGGPAGEKRDRIFEQPPGYRVRRQQRLLPHRLAKIKAKPAFRLQQFAPEPIQLALKRQKHQSRKAGSYMLHAASLVSGTNFLSGFSFRLGWTP